MNHLRAHCAVLVLASSLLTLPVVAHAQFEFVTNNTRTITITRYTGPGGDVIIPSTINGLPVSRLGLNHWEWDRRVFRPGFEMNQSVTGVVVPNSVTFIGDETFGCCSNLAHVILGNSVSHIGDMAFVESYNLKAVYFLGGPPWMGYPGINPRYYRAPTIYRLRWVGGWGQTLWGWPIETWNPVDWPISMVEGRSLSHSKAILDCLYRARDFVDREAYSSAANQLRAFQNKVRAQVRDADLARDLIEAAQQVIEAL
jgi:hypothetical protein